MALLNYLWLLTILESCLCSTPHKCGSPGSACYSSSQISGNRSVMTCRELKSSDLDDLYQRVQGNSAIFVKRLGQAIKIPSVSSDPEHRQDLLRMINWVDRILKEELGFTTQVVWGKIDDSKAEGTTYNLAPFLLATSPPLSHHNSGLSVKSARKLPPTLLVYGHLDVVAANKADGWDMEDPFSYEQINGFVYGRGATDDKGPLVAWLNALLTLKEAGFCLPLNIKFFFEAMEESGSKGSQDILRQTGPHAKFFSDIDWAVVTDNYWLKPSSPALTYGLRGLLYFYVEVKGLAQNDLHSGVYGGTVVEPMAELMAILATLVDSRGRILIEGIYEDVAPFTEEEKKAYELVDFDVSQYYGDIVGRRSKTKQAARYGVNKTQNSQMADDRVGMSKVDVLAARWRQPSLSIHGIEGAGKKSVISHKVIGKFSIRIVPFQDPKRVERLVTDHIMAFHHSNWSGSSNRIRVSLAERGVEAWYTQPWNNSNFASAQRAMIKVYGKKPDYTREGGSIPAVTYLSRVLPIVDSIILMPISSAQDGAHSQNEKISVAHFINGTKLMLTYMDEISRVGPNRGKRFWTGN